MTESVETAIERFEKRNRGSKDFWRAMYADLLSWCRVNELQASQPEVRGVCRQCGYTILFAQSLPQSERSG